MTKVEDTIVNSYPKLRLIAPQSFWFSVIFGTFNTIIGLGLITTTFLGKLIIVGVIPIKLWGVIFIVHGLALLLAIVVNNWKLSRALHLVGVAIKTAWWLELISESFSGVGFPFILFVWTTLLLLQSVVYLYFYPRVGRV